MRVVTLTAFLFLWPTFARAADSDAFAQRLVQRGLVRLVNTEGLRRPVAVVIEADVPEVELIHIAAEATGHAYVSGGNATIVTTVTEKVCRAPCNEVVEGHISARYFLQGDGVTPSKTFELPPFAALRIKVKAGSLMRRRAGVTMMTVGFLGVLGGAAFVLYGAIAPSPVEPASGLSTNTRNGLIVGGAGIGLTLAGLFLGATSETSYEFEPVAAPAVKATGGPDTT